MSGKGIILLFFVSINCIDLISSEPPPRLRDRIVGGTDGNITELSYQASIQILYFGSRYPVCGGTIVNKRTIVSAAHCFDGRNYTATGNPFFSYVVRVASPFTYEGGQLVNVAEIIVHPSYIGRTYNFDVAVLKLSSDLEFTSNVNFIQLAPTGYEVIPGTMLRISGWGTTKFGGIAANRLQVVEVPLVSDDKCRDVYKAHFTENMICAAPEAGGKDACQGDSGGPLVDTRTNVLVGIISFGHKCALPGFPGVYAKVAALRDFIDNFLN